ncbi:SH3 domain-containing protein [Rhizobium sp.]
MKSPAAQARIVAWVAVVLAATTLPAVGEVTKLTTGLPIPRFVTLKAKKVNLRVGPGQDYAVSWRYLKAGVPVEITQEFENWRRIRDADGAEGWVFHSLLSGDRGAIAAPWMKTKGPDIFVNMRSDARDTGSIVAKLQPGVVVKLDECNGQWCHAEAKDVEGWVSQAEIWGAYPGEAFTK